MESDWLIPNQATLVKYDEPVLIRALEDNEDNNFNLRGINESVETEIKTLMELRKNGPSCQNMRAPGVSSMQELLNLLIGPNEWVENDHLFKQSVSEEEAHRDNVTSLAVRLKKKMTEHNGKTTGFCPIRRELFFQFFNELIREITIECPERGLLLARIRDEMRMSLDASRDQFDACKNYETAPPSNTTNLKSAKSELEGPEDSDSSFSISISPTELRFQEILKEEAELRDKIRGLEDGLKLKELCLQEQLNAELIIFEKEKEHLLKVQNQLQKQLELFQGPNPHDARETVSILDKFLHKTN